MKSLLIGAALLILGVSPSFAAITCWYNGQGNYTGADDADKRFPMGKLTKGKANGDYAWGYTVPGDPSSCPRKAPKK